MNHSSLSSYIVNIRCKTTASTPFYGLLIISFLKNQKRMRRPFAVWKLTLCSVMLSAFFALSLSLAFLFGTRAISTKHKAEW